MNKDKRILCFTENLISGGAERQFVNLASLLKNRGYDVHVLVYHPADHFKYVLDEADIIVELVKFHNKIHRIWAIRKAIRRSNPDVVIAFKNRPSLYAELAGFPRRNFKLIVSERNFDYRGVTLGNRIRFFFHRFSDAVVANSISQYEFIRDVDPRLKKKTNTITNCLDLDGFLPQESEHSEAGNCLKLLVLGRFDEQKNPFTLLEAIDLLRKKHSDLKVLVDWYGDDYFVDGRPTKLSACYIRLRDLVEERDMAGVFRLHKPVKDVVPLLRNCCALCLPSIYEGFSNVIAEAIACGKPVLAGDVSDNSRMVEDGVSGFLFDPNSPDEIANTILRFWELSPEERSAMGKAGRQRAEKLLAPQRFVEQYEQLILGLRQPGAVPTGS